MTFHVTLKFQFDFRFNWIEFKIYWNRIKTNWIQIQLELDSIEEKWDANSYIMYWKNSWKCWKKFKLFVLKMHFLSIITLELAKHIPIWKSSKDDPFQGITHGL